MKPQPKPDLSSSNSLWDYSLRLYEHDKDISHIIRAIEMCNDAIQKLMMWEHYENYRKISNIGVNPDDPINIEISAKQKTCLAYLDHKIACHEK